MRYLIVSTDLADLTVKGGPILAQAGFDPGPGRKLISEAEAAAGGYTFPARPAAEVNADDLRDRARAAIATNLTFLANGSPTNAQVVAQVRALTRECTALVRLLVGQFDTTDGA